MWRNAQTPALHRMADGTYTVQPIFSTGCWESPRDVAMAQQAWAQLCRRDAALPVWGALTETERHDRVHLRLAQLHYEDQFVVDRAIPMRRTDAV